jgi:hypothetical protein
MMLKKEELLKIDDKDGALRFGRMITDIKIISNHQPIANITEFESYKQ